MTNILKNLSNLIVGKKNLFLLIWIAVIALSLTFISLYKDENIETELTGAIGTEAYKAGKILESEFNLKSGNSAAIVTEEKIDADKIIPELKNKFPQIENIFEVKSPNKHRYKIIYFDYYPQKLFVEVQALTQELRDFIKPIEKKYNSKIYVSGNASFYYDMKTAGKEDSSKGEIIALIFSLIILIFNFGALVSALIPVIIGATTLIFANAFEKTFGMEINPISQVMSSLVGLALSIDYSLFIVSRFREELKNGKNHQDALSIALANSGRTIIVSALIMLCSISVLLLPDVSTSRTIVKNLLVVITVSFFNSIFFLPVFLIHARNFLDKPKFLAKYLKHSDNYLFWRKFASMVVASPKAYFVLSSSLLILLALPAYYIKLWEPSQTLVPPASESMIGYRLLEKDNWGGELVPIEIIVKTPDNVYTKESVSFIYNFTKYLQKNENVASVQSITSWNKAFAEKDYFNLYSSLYSAGFISQINQISSMVNIDKGSNTTLVKVYPKSLMDIEASHDIINYARDFNKDSKYQVFIGGMVARAKDFTKELYAYIPLMMTVILLSIYILLLFYMKSVILPIKAGIMNFLPIISAYGVLTLIFQYGYFHELLNTPVNNAVTAMVPISLFCIVFGLSMDYEVLILSRISETYYETKDVKEAVIEGLSRSGAVITGAALILLVVFIPGIFSSSPGIKEICIGIISAIFIDSTIVRLFLVPSLVVLMGKWNWWTPFGKSSET